MSVSRVTFLAGGATALAASSITPAIAAGPSASILALYKEPSDPKAFDTYYTNHHIPLAKTLPGLQSYTFSKGLTDNDPYYLVAILTFPSMDALKSAMASFQGKAVVADLKYFAQAGVDILTFDNIPA